MITRPTLSTEDGYQLVDTSLTKKKSGNATIVDGIVQQGSPAVFTVEGRLYAPSHIWRGVLFVCDGHAGL